MKKLILAIIIVAIGVVFYTEKTGKTHFQAMFSEYVLGIDPEEADEEGGAKYTLAEKKNQPAWDPGKEAIKDANSYHKEAKEFANKTNNTVNAINDAVK